MLDFWIGTGIAILYIVICGGVMGTVRLLTKIPDELFRKLLHFILLGAYIPLLYAYKVWWHAIIFVAALAVLLYPALYFGGKIPKFSEFVNERKGGEFKSSMLLALGVMLGSTAICWGLLGDKLLTIACVYAWGVGDAFAALVGKKWGRHKIKWKLADGKKSIEGSAAMFISAFISVLTVLLIRGGIDVLPVIFTALLAAAVVTVIELITSGGFDTVTCPAAALAIIIPMVYLFGG